MKRNACRLAVMLVTLLLSTQALAMRMPALEAAKARSLAAPRISTGLREGDRSDNAAAALPPLLRSAGTSGSGLVRVNIRVKGDTAAALTQLNAHGLAGAIASIRAHMIEGWIAPDQLHTIAALPVVRFVSEPQRGFTRAAGSGSVVSEGVALLGADRLQVAGATGSNIRVGVISDGVRGLTTAQNSGNLPANVTVLANPCTPTSSGDCAEGTAMLEIVHDMAPSATLGFCGPQTLLDMSNCVNQLVSVFHADVVVDDLGYLEEPTFEDGVLGTTINTQVAGGLLYVSAAGNSRGCHYEADYNPVATSAGIYDSQHGFESGADYNKVLVAPGSAIVAVLQWNDPFDTSSNDYDLFVTDATGTILQSSTDIQDGGTAPATELIRVRNRSGVTQEVRLVITRKSGAQARHLKLFMFDGSSGCDGLTQIDNRSVRGDISGHPAASGAITVAAVDAFNVGAPPVPESFSSTGPVRIDFPLLEMRAKPDIAGIDNVSVSGAGGFGYSGGAPGTCPGKCFLGTSAAAPHVAGVLALLKGNFSGDYRQVTATTARGASPGTLGAGLIDAYAAATSMATAPVAAIASPATDITISAGQSVTLSGSCSDAQGLNDSYAWNIDSIGNSTALAPGALTFTAAGTHVVTFHCSNPFGMQSNTDSRTITVTAAPPAPASGGGGGGGATDTLLLIALAGLGLRKWRSR